MALTIMLTTRTKQTAKNKRLRETAMCRFLKSFIGKVIESHMGPWNTDYNGNEVLPKPKTKYENFVHMCDYLSSKKFLNVNFVNGEIEE